MEKYLLKKWITSKTVYLGLFKIKYSHFHKKYVAKVPMRLPDLKVLGFALENGQIRYRWEDVCWSYPDYSDVFSMEVIPESYYEEKVSSSYYILDLPDDDSAILWFTLQYGG
jgi:hypothetical protein